MSEYLYHYHPVEPATWFYLSSLLMIGLFFKFSRLWSVRNLDLLLLILLAPGMLFIYYGAKLDLAATSDRTAEAGQRAVESSTERPAVGEGTTDGDPRRVSTEERTNSDRVDQTGPNTPANGVSVGASDGGTSAEMAPGAIPANGRTQGQRIQLYGYLWLFFCGVLLMARLLADPTMVRRPLLEPNLTAGGLTFIGCSLFVFLTANVIGGSVEAATVDDAVAQAGDEALQSDADIATSRGPGYALLARLTGTMRMSLSILSQLAIVIGMVLIGYWHFDNIVMGIGAATMYLMLPYTARTMNEITHVLPAACLVWGVLCYRRPLASGLCLGLACGMTYYPLFLLPLWCSFYWPRGLLRFLGGVGTMLVVLMFVLFSSHDVFHNIRLMFGLIPPAMENLQGVWDSSLGGWNSYYRLPVMATFVALAGSMALWPAQKNLGTLLSCSAAVMVASQFWHGYGGGTYIAWYLPLLLLTIFRPNLEDRVALTVLAEGWLPRRFSALPSGKAA